MQDVVVLIRSYAHELFERDASVTPEALLDDGFGSVLEFFVVDSGAGALAGFAAWEKTYDVISGRRGGALLGLYVEEKLRRRGTGQALITAVANEVRAIGGVFLVGPGGMNVELADEVQLAHLIRVRETGVRAPSRSRG